MATASATFRGLTQKLDYLQELGVTRHLAAAVLSFATSRRRLRHRRLLFASIPATARSTISKRSSRPRIDRGIRVITELVLNHTSDQHPWFQESRKSRDNPRRDWYVWSDTDTDTAASASSSSIRNYQTGPGTRSPKSYYWHRFFSHQPDLNFDNPAVREEIWNVMKFWLEMGVDGFRLDAVPYLVEREGTSCENLPETHAVLKELRRET